MKSTQTINLNGQLFNIDTDAYQLLDAYIKNLNSFFAKDPESKEIIEDIEGRIRELLSAKRPNPTDIITIADVEEVIRTVGNPSDFGLDEETSSNQNRGSGYSAPSSNLGKKLFRNPRDKMLGGVCSGLAEFTGIDVTLIRVIVAVLGIASIGTVLLIYLVFWILVPEARTAEDILRMSGEAVTVENIGRVTFANNMGETYTASSLQNNNNGCLSGFLKIALIGLALVVLIPVALAIIVAIMGLFIAMAGSGGEVLWDGMYAFYLTTAFIVILIPIIALIYVILAGIFKWKPMSNALKVSALVIWIIALALSIYGIASSSYQEIRDNVSKTFGQIDRYEISGNGEMTSQSITLTEAINSLEVSGGLEIKIQIDPTIQSDTIVVLESDANVLDNLTTSTIGSKLSISPKRGSILNPTMDYIILKVKSNTWQKISLLGASELSLPEIWQMGKATIVVSGASEFDASNLNIDSLYVYCSGASETNLVGLAKYLDAEVSGASELDAEKLISENSVINVSGASSAEVNTLKSLSGKVSGASDVEYIGNPATMQVESSGASSIKKKR